MAIAESPIATGPLLGASGAGSAPPLELVATGTPAFGFDIVIAEFGQPSFGIEISVITPLVFSASDHYVRWAPVVMIGEAEISARLTGQVSVEGEEDSARVAEFSVIPESAAALAAFDGQPVTIDVVLERAGQWARYRRFTGVVEAVQFAPAAQVATITCRDGFQERVKACASAAEVEALFGGLATLSPAAIAWNDTEPDPVAYFGELLDTLRGAVTVDGNGFWRVIPWTIGAPQAVFSQDEFFEETMNLSWPDRSELPSAIEGTLNLRHARLHAVELPIEWEAVGYVRYIVDGLPTCPKSMVQAAVSGLSEWIVKGTATYEQPVPGIYSVIVGGNEVHYVVSYEAAPITCQRLAVTLYRRWYQEVDTAYRFSLELGGSSSRDDAVAVSLQSEFDAGEWESARSSNTDLGLYQANAPTPLPGEVVPTGYEGLPAPYPAANSALDWRPDFPSADLDAAAAVVVAKTLRKAGSALRKRRVSFVRPFDPRWELGDVLGVTGYGVTARGQVVAFKDVLDIDSGAIETSLTLACPAGTGETTAFTASIEAPPAEVAHALIAPLLGNPVGAAYETPERPVESGLQGFLCNVLPTSDNYDASKPVYEPQFRIVMPEIPADVRDPLAVESVISVAWSIAAGDFELSF